MAQFSATLQDDGSFIILDANSATHNVSATVIGAAILSARQRRANIGISDAITAAGSSVLSEGTHIHVVTLDIKRLRTNADQVGTIALLLATVEASHTTTTIDSYVFENYHSSEWQFDDAGFGASNEAAEGLAPIAMQLVFATNSTLNHSDPIIPANTRVRVVYNGKIVHNFVIAEQRPLWSKWQPGGGVVDEALGTLATHVALSAIVGALFDVIPTLVHQSIEPSPNVYGVLTYDPSTGAITYPFGDITASTYVSVFTAFGDAIGEKEGLTVDFSPVLAALATKPSAIQVGEVVSAAVNNGANTVKSHVDLKATAIVSDLTGISNTNKGLVIADVTSAKNAIIAAIDTSDSSDSPLLIDMAAYLYNMQTGCGSTKRDKRYAEGLAAFYQKHPELEPRTPMMNDFKEDD